MKQESRNAVIIAFAVLAVPVCVFLGCRGAAKPETPSVAQIMGVRIGEDTLEDLERALGPGAPCLGGHPHSARAWFITPHNVYVYADAFEYSDAGAVIDEIRIGFRKDDLGISGGYQEPEPKIPRVDVGDRAIGWLGSILPGASRKAVLRLTKGLPEPARTKDELGWHMHGDRDGYGGLAASLRFDKDRLMAVQVFLCR